MNFSNSCGQENSPGKKRGQEKGTGVFFGAGPARHRRFRAEASDWNLGLRGGGTLVLGKLGGGAGHRSNGTCRLYWTIDLVFVGDYTQLGVYRMAREIGQTTSGIGNGHNGKVAPPSGGA